MAGCLEEEEGKGTVSHHPVGYRVNSTCNPTLIRPIHTMVYSGTSLLRTLRTKDTSLMRTVSAVKTTCVLYREVPQYIHIQTNVSQVLEHKSATLPDTCYSCSHIPVHCSSPPGTPRHCSGLPGGTVWWQCGQRGPPETNLNSARRRRYQHQWAAPRRKACCQHQPGGRTGSALTCTQ